MNMHKKAGLQPGSSEELIIKHVQHNCITKNVKLGGLKLQGRIPVLIKHSRQRKIEFIWKPIRKRHYDSSEPAFASCSLKRLPRVA
jgi:hypothetical protein